MSNRWSMNTAFSDEHGCFRTSLVSRPVWYDDGDIVLEVMEGKDKYQYRVHRLLLCMSSSIFRDTLEMPQRADSKELDGCLVIPLHDSPGDLSALLTALYNGLAMHHNNQLTFDVALSVLLLSDKYNMEDLRRGITRILLECWPLNHSDYIICQRLFGSSECRVVQSMRLIEVAQRCEVPKLLPTAFYELANSRIQDWSELEISASHHLSPADLARLLVGRERSAQRLRKLVVWDDKDPPTMWSPNVDTESDPVIIFASRERMPACSGPSTARGWVPTLGVYFCANLFTLLGKRILEQPETVFKFLRETRYAILGNSGACRACVDWLIPVLTNKEQEMWENVAVDFDLPKVDPKLYSESMFKPF